LVPSRTGRGINSNIHPIIASFEAFKLEIKQQQLNALDCLRFAGVEGAALGWGGGSGVTGHYTLVGILFHATASNRMPHKHSAIRGLLCPALSKIGDQKYNI